MPTPPEPLDDASIAIIVEGYRKYASEFTIEQLEAPIQPGDVARLLATLDQQTRRIEAIRAIHRPRQCGCSDPECTAHTLADCCYGEEWPCPTIRALDA